VKTAIAATGTSRHRRRTAWKTAARLHLATGSAALVPGISEPIPEAAPYPGSARWVAMQPGYLAPRPATLGKIVG
jgi:hypothetical protein